MRTMLRLNEASGNCIYLGYDVSRTWKSRVGFNHTNFRDIAQLLNSPASGAPRRVCVEAHVVARSFWSDLARLRASAFALRCSIHVILRVREPFSWYCSFYNWGVRGRQRTGDRRWGLNFTDWLPHNLQSKMLLWGNFANEDPLDDSRYMNGAGIGHRRGWLRPGAGAAVRLKAAQRTRLDELMRLVDVAAPLDRFDEALAMLTCQSKFLTTSQYRRVVPAPNTGPWTQRARKEVGLAQQLCSGEREAGCRAAVRR